MDELERKAKAAAYQLAWYHRNKERVSAEARAKYVPHGTRRKWTEADVIAEIQSIAVGGVAACPSGGSLPNTATRLFGSWTDACIAAGVVNTWNRPLAPDSKYSTVHWRLARERGRPKACEECGFSGTERRYEWALNLDVVDPLLNENGMPYSLAIHEDYRRLCKSCHVLQDARRGD